MDDDDPMFLRASPRGRLRHALAQRLRERLAGRVGALASFGDAALDVPAGIERLADVAYGDHPRHRLDVYGPATAASGSASAAPVLVMAHGGGWARGDKTHAPSIVPKLRHWSAAGWIVASVNYRFVPDANPREQAQDLACALAFVQERLAAWGGDAARIVLMGHSAGAHLAALVSADDRLRAAAGVRPWLATVALDGAALDVVRLMRAPHFALFDRAFGCDESLWRDASPTLVLRAAPAVPMLMVASARRADSCAQAEAFAERARGLGGEVQVLKVDLTHAQINELTGAAGPLTAAVDDFVRAACAAHGLEGGSFTPVP